MNEVMKFANQSINRSLCKYTITCESTKLKLHLCLVTYDTTHLRNRDISPGNENVVTIYSKLYGFLFMWNTD